MCIYTYNCNKFSNSRINFSINGCRNSMEQLSVAEGKLGNVMNRLLGVDIFNKKLEMDEER